MSVECHAHPVLARSAPVRVFDRATTWLGRLPHSALALLARFAIATTFWVSAQTKVEGLVVDPIGFHLRLGLPHVSASAVELFRSEYALPLIPPELAAWLAATTEHVGALLLLLGLASRLSALALLAMTLVIEIFVYPDAYPTHALWAMAMLYVIARGPGRWSLDALAWRCVHGHDAGVPRDVRH